MTTSHKIDVLGLDFQRNGKKRASASEATSRASSVEPGSAAFAVGALHGALKLDWCFGDCEEVLLLAGSETTDSMIFYVWAFAHMCTYVCICFIWKTSIFAFGFIFALPLPGGPQAASQASHAFSQPLSRQHPAISVKDSP